jgi:pyruvate-formate lyase-activating enzyme
MATSKPPCTQRAHPLGCTDESGRKVRKVERFLYCLNFYKTLIFAHRLRWSVDGHFLVEEGRSMHACGTQAEAAGAPPSAGPKAEIPSVDWWTTSHCNLACDFCYGPVPGKDPVELRPEILQALAASSARVVTFCGGEPLLIPKIGEYAAALGRCGKSTVLNTNGQLLRRRLDRGLRLTDFAMVGISIDGSTPEIHHEMRGKGADLYEVIDAARLVTKEPGVSLKLATVVSSVNREDLPALAETVRDLAPDIWRLYQYSSRGDQNFGQRRHWLADDEFQRLVKEAADLSAPVPTAPSAEAETQGCLIVDPAGNVLQPAGTGYLRRGNCLMEPLDRIWAAIPAQSTIINNKRWLLTSIPSLIQEFGRRSPLMVNLGQLYGIYAGLGQAFC